MLSPSKAHPKRFAIEESGAQDSIQQHRMSRLREPTDREMSDPRGSPMTICEQLRYNGSDEHSAGILCYLVSLFVVDLNGGQEHQRVADVGFIELLR